MGDLLKQRPILATAGPALTLVAVLTIALWAWLFGTWSVWPWLVCWLLAVNPIAFATYGIDKSLAKREGWRIPEATLFVLALLGGSPAAFVAMHVFRHKTVKGTFRIVFWLIVLIQIVLIIWVAKIMWTKE
jgi:uncharacterized membrane protein YsdA (DUF1294 family)